MKLSFLSSRTISIVGLALGLSILSILQLPAAAQASGCTLTLVESLLPAAMVPGTLVVGDNQTALSSLFSGGERGKIVLVCLNSFSATINDSDIQQVQSTGVTEFASIDAEVTDISSPTIIGPVYVLSIDLTATAPNTSIIGAGDYSFTVPVTISGN